MNGPPSPTDEARDAIALRLGGHELALLDAWRRQQPDRPSRAEAARRLVAEALGGESLGDGYIDTRDLSSANDG